MMLNRVPCGVYEVRSSRNLVKPRGPYDLSIPYINFLEKLEEAAHDRLGKQLDFHPHAFDAVKSPNAELREEKIAICLYPTIPDVGPEFHELLVGFRHAYRHIMAVFIEEYSFELEQYFKNLIRMSLLMNAREETNSGLLIADLSVTNGEGINNKIVTQWNLNAIQDENQREQMLAYL